MCSHHPKKIALILSAMRHFAAELEGEGWTRRLCASSTRPATPAASPARSRARRSATRATAIRIVEAGEWRVQQMILGWEAALGVPVEVLADDRFLVFDRRRSRPGRRAGASW